MTTKHLNLRWTVGDMDRLAFMQANSHLTVDQVADRLAGTPLRAAKSKLVEIAGAFGVRLAEPNAEVSA